MIAKKKEPSPTAELEKLCEEIAQEKADEKALSVKQQKVYSGTRILTIYSDASWCPNKKVGGWGSWMRFEDTIHRAGGPLLAKTVLESSNDAETAAAANALSAAFHQGMLEQAKMIVFVIDSLHAGGVINGTINPSTDTQKMALAFIKKVAASHGVSVKANHVKGH